MCDRATLASRLPVLLAHGAALLCVAAAATSANCAAQEALPLGGRLYMSVFKRLPPEAVGNARQIVVVDMETGAYEEIGATGRGPRVSLDGKRIAYWVAGADNESVQAWIKQLDRAEEPRFLAYGHVKAWLNDGNELLLTDVLRAKDGKEMVYSTYYMDSGGTNRRELELSKDVYLADCTPDGKRLLVGGVEHGQLHLVAASGGEPTRVSLPNEIAYSGRLSHDGQQVGYIAPGRPFRVIVVNVDGSHQREVYRGEGLTDPSHLCWSPDGEHLAIVLSDWIEKDGRRIKTTNPKYDHNYRVLVLDNNGKRQRRLILEGLAALSIGELDWK